MKWESLTSPELDRYPRTTPVLLGLAAIEQHGPHLPMATDRMIVDHFLDRLDQLHLEKNLILPTLAVGCSSHHLDFPGSLSLSHETFTALAIESVASAYHHGFRRFFILNAHGGNIGVGQVILEKLGDRFPEATFIFTSWWRLVGPELLPLCESPLGGVGHACEFETSLIQYISPASVRPLIPFQRTNSPTPTWAESDMLRGSRASLFKTIQQMTPNGVYGDPWLASPEKGEKISNAVIDHLLKILTDFPSK